MMENIIVGMRLIQIIVGGGSNAPSPIKPSIKCVRRQAWIELWMGTQILITIIEGAHNMVPTQFGCMGEAAL